MGALITLKYIRWLNKSVFEYFRLHKHAGVIFLVTGGLIPPMATEHMETSCAIEEHKVIHPFAFRVHTHSLGKVVTGYRIRDGKWTMIGQRDPMKPQMFYPVNNGSDPIQFGDMLAARCTMQSTRNRTTHIGYATSPLNLYLFLLNHTHAHFNGNI